MMFNFSSMVKQSFTSLLDAYHIHSVLRLHNFVLLFEKLRSLLFNSGMVSVLLIYWDHFFIYDVRSRIYPFVTCTTNDISERVNYTLADKGTFQVVHFMVKITELGN